MNPPRPRPHREALGVPLPSDPPVDTSENALKWARAAFEKIDAERDARVAYQTATDLRFAGIEKSQEDIKAGLKHETVKQIGAIVLSAVATITAAIGGTRMFDQPASKTVVQKSEMQIQGELCEKFTDEVVRGKCLADVLARHTGPRP